MQLGDILGPLPIVFGPKCLPNRIHRVCNFSLQEICRAEPVWTDAETGVEYVIHWSSLGDDYVSAEAEALDRFSRRDFPPLQDRVIQRRIKVGLQLGESGGALFAVVSERGVHAASLSLLPQLSLDSNPVG